MHHECQKVTISVLNVYIRFPFMIYRVADPQYSYVIIYTHVLTSLLWDPLSKYFGICTFFICCFQNLFKGEEEYRLEEDCCLVEICRQLIFYWKLGRSGLVYWRQINKYWRLSFSHKKESWQLIFLETCDWEGNDFRQSSWIIVIFN